MILRQANITNCELGTYDNIFIIECISSRDEVEY